MASEDILYVGNDNILEVDELKNAASAAFLNSATVTVTLEDSTGTEVTGDTWPKSLTYVTSSDGKYRATMLDTLSLTADALYTAKITADGGSGLLAYWERPLYARSRTD